ncbi:MAG: phosphatidate cytidylyltransferase [Acidobacteria bacterium]|nr:phosphatidate cytidylyltransferase [Acidobacteriota bacterium]
MKRIVTSALLVPLVCWVIVAAPYPVFWGVVLLLGVLCYREYLRLAAGHGYLTMPVAGYTAGLLLLAPLPTPAAAQLPLIFAVAALALALRTEDLKRALGSAGAFVLGVLYVFGAWAAALSLRQSSAHWLLFAVAINWVGDVSAFYAGRAFGKHKLAPVISPGKSWEGAVASMGGALLFAVFYLGWALPEIPLWQRLLLGAVGNVAGQVGDLAESALKRGAGVKDSGTMLPGHGGWLDRLDSSLFSMPVVAAVKSLLVP